MIEHVNEGAPLQIRAVDWNLMADAANAYAESIAGEGGAFGAKNKAAGAGAYCMVHLQYDVAACRALAVIPNYIGDAVGRSQWPTVFRSGHLSASNVFDPVGIAMIDGKAGDIIPVCLSGPCVIEVPGLDTGNTYNGWRFARPDPTDSTDGTLIPSSWGPLRIVKRNDSSNKPYWIAINSGGPVWNVGTYQTPNAKIYTIDKTQRVSVENKSWNPIAGTPNDWATYDAVELITWSMEYLGGGSWRMVKYSQTWQAPNAPIISASTEESTLLTQQRYPNPDQQIVVFNPDTPLT